MRRWRAGVMIVTLLVAAAVVGNGAVGSQTGGTPGTPGMPGTPNVSVTIVCDPLVRITSLPRECDATFAAQLLTATVDAPQETAAARANVATYEAFSTVSAGYTPTVTPDVMLATAAWECRYQIHPGQNCLAVVAQLSATIHAQQTQAAQP